MLTTEQIHNVVRHSFGHKQDYAMSQMDALRFFTAIEVLIRTEFPKAPIQYWQGDLVAYDWPLALVMTFPHQGKMTIVMSNDVDNNLIRQINECYLLKIVAPVDTPEPDH